MNSLRGAVAVWGSFQQTSSAAAVLTLVRTAKFTPTSAATALSEKGGRSDGVDGEGRDELAAMSHVEHHAVPPVARGSAGPMGPSWPCSQNLAK